MTSWRTSLRSGLIALGLLMSARPALSQVADHYRGTVVNDAEVGHPADLELFVYLRTDSSTIGWMKVGKPLEGSGVTAVVTRDLDSLYFVTLTSAGDTIVWASPKRTGTLEGRYWINGANYEGEGGRWRLAPQSRVSSVALTMFALCLAAFVVLIIAALSSAQHPRWWAWRARNIRPTAEDRAKFAGVQGWLAWLMVGQSILAIYLLINVWDTNRSLGGTWMLGAALPGMRPLLFVEAVGHFLQFFGIVLGLVLIWRHSRLAPMYWVSLLALMMIYAVLDISGGSAVKQEMVSMFGADAADGLREMETASAQNFRLILSAAIWSLYWIRSRRVFVVFGPPPETPAVSAAEANLSASMDSMQLPSATI